MKYEHNAEFSVARDIDSIFNNIAIIIKQRNGVIVEKNEYSLVAKLGNRFVARLLGISLLSLVKKYNCRHSSLLTFRNWMKKLIVYQ